MAERVAPVGPVDVAVVGIPVGASDQRVTAMSAEAFTPILTC